MKKDFCYLVTSLLLFLMPAFLFGQAPNLGAASGFALFTKAGAFSNVGTSSLTGDIGSNSVTVTGFPPGIVVGTIHNPPDPTLAQAALDVVTAYSDLSAIACGVTIGTTLGNNQVLVPGVYCQSAATILNGDLTLDGGGDPNALFIIKIGGALITNANSRVILTNSTSLCNVYWQITGQVDLAGSVFRGTILSQGAINLSNGSSLEGRGLSTGGAITLNNNVVTIPQSVGTPAFALGATSNRCQEAGTVTYTATAINNNGITYNLDATTAAFAGNSIVATTGIVTYAVGWSGTTIITASAAGCDGPKTAIHTVTVYPSSLTSAITHQ
jgi:hypothetical protein